MPVPEALIPPEIQDADGYYLTAFQRLCSERPLDAANAPIPWRAIKDYAELCSHDEEQLHRLMFTVMEIDTAYCDFYRAKAKAKEE